MSPNQHLFDRLGQHSFEKWVGYLDRTLPFDGLVFAEPLGGEGRATESGGVCGFADQDDGVRLVCRLIRHSAPHDPRFLHQPDGDDVDQTVIVVTGVEEGIAAKVGHAEGVAVLSDAVDDPPSDVFDPGGVRAVGVAEPERVHHTDHVGTHAVHVADNPPDAGRRALDGQNLRGVIVAFVRDDHAPALAVDLGESDDAGVLPRAQDNVRRLGGKVLAQHRPRAFVRAVFAPHGIEYVELDGRRRAPEQVTHALEFVSGQTHVVRLEQPLEGGPVGWVTGDEVFGPYLFH